MDSLETNTKSGPLREVDRSVGDGTRRAGTGQITWEVSIKLKRFWYMSLKPTDETLRD